MNVDEGADITEDDLPGDGNDKNLPGVAPIPLVPTPGNEREETGEASPLPSQYSGKRYEGVGVPYQAGTPGPVAHDVSGAAVVPIAAGYAGTGGGASGIGGSGRRRSGRQL